MRQSFEPKIWGPHAWFFLETIAMAYPTNPTKKQIKRAKQFYKSLEFMIPCDKCRNNYKKHCGSIPCDFAEKMKVLPITDEVLANRTNLFNWTVKLHNMSFPTKKRTNQQTFEHYMNIYQPKSKTGKRIISLAIVACVTVILTILLRYAF